MNVTKSKRIKGITILEANGKDLFSQSHPSLEQLLYTIMWELDDLKHSLNKKSKKKGKKR